MPFGSENSRTRAWLCGALRRFGSCSAPLPTMSNNMACGRPISQTIDACSTASAPSPANGVSRARFRSNNGNMFHAAMLAGAGIGFVPTFVAGRNLAEGRLISLMPDYQPVESELSVIYPPGKNLSAIRSIAIEQVSHSRPFEVLELQAHSISRANTRMSFSSSFGILSFHTG